MFCTKYYTCMWPNPIKLIKKEKVTVHKVQVSGNSCQYLRNNIFKICHKIWLNCSWNEIKKLKRPLTKNFLNSAVLKVMLDKYLLPFWDLRSISNSANLTVWSNSLSFDREWTKQLSTICDKTDQCEYRYTRYSSISNIKQS